jgi:hypothetical protein
MIAKVLILALAAAVNCQYISNYNTGLYGAGLGGLGGYYGAGVSGGVVGGLPVYRSSALYGGLYGANNLGYGANFGRVAGLGALRTTGAIVGGGALGYGTGALVAGGLPAYGVAAPAVSTIGLAPAVSQVGLGVSHGSLGVNQYLSNLNIARGVSVQQAGPVNAAVHTISRTVDYRPVPYSGEPAAVQDIDVPPQESPLRINFQSKSSPLAVTQQHIPAEPGQVQVTQSEDEPQTAVHQVTRPVIQQVQEVIQPYRTLTQVVEPVIEQTHTNIAQGEGVRLTGLTSGIVGGTGQLAASGVGIAGVPVVSGAVVQKPLIGGLGLTQGYGLAGHTGLYNTGLIGARAYGTGYNTGLIGARAYGTGLNTGIIGAQGYGLGGYRTLGYGYGNGLALNGLSGLSTYGTTAKIARY